jgi:ABC-type sugar transport system permease subunit
MDDFITIYYWIRLAVLVAVAVVGLIAAIRMSSRRTLRSWREVLLALFATLMFVALATIVGVTFGPLYGGVLALVGLLIGYLANRGRSVTREEGRDRVRPSPLTAWVWFIAVTIVAATLLFGDSYVFALSMLLLAFAVGLVVGQTIALLRLPREVAAAMPSPMTEAGAA